MIEYSSKTYGWFWLLLFWIPLLVLLKTIMCIVFNMSLSLGEIITIAITLTSIGIALYFYFHNLYQKHFAFDLGRSLDPVQFGADESRERQVEKILKLKTNTMCDVIIAIKSKQPYTTKKVHLYFNQTKGNKGHAPKSEIEILNVKDEHKDTWHYPYLECTPVLDGIGGIDIHYKEPIEKAKQDKLYLTVKIKTYKAWKGYLVFYCLRNDRNRGYGYLPVEIT